jgi:catechol 2,3-dioxygenase-like lactoylglutathione lyase family enzyme
MSHPFQIDFLDHVAILVQDMERSAQWYEEVLGMDRVQPEEWKPFPIFMLAGNTGVAIFPEKESQAAMVDHFAFRVDGESFEAAQVHLEKLNIPFRLEDHTYFQSIYLQDPDQHKVELTTFIRPMD